MSTEYEANVPTAGVKGGGGGTKTDLPSWLQPQNPEGTWNHHPLLLIVGRGNSLKDLQPIECLCASLGFVRDHSSDCPPEYPAGSTEVIGST